MLTIAKHWSNEKEEQIDRILLQKVKSRNFPA